MPTRLLPWDCLAGMARVSLPRRAFFSCPTRPLYLPSSLPLSLSLALNPTLPPPRPSLRQGIKPDSVSGLLARTGAHIAI